MLCDKTCRSVGGRSAVTKLHQTVQSAGMYQIHYLSVNFWKVERFSVKDKSYTLETFYVT